MIGWLQPWALWGLGLAALPLVIHLLQRQRAKRVLFPSTRFVHPSRTAAVRFRRPSDLILLAIRMAIVALAALAAAQPIWLSSGRLAAWDARIARAVVVDSSESMQARRPDGTTPAEDAAAAADTEASAEFVRRIASAELGEGIRQAAAWLRAAPPARRELVVVSDFQLGSIGPETMQSIDPEIGIRFRQASRTARGGDTRNPAAFDGVSLLPVPGENGATQRIHLSGEGTQLRVENNDFISTRGVRVIGASEGEGQRLLATLALAGTPAPDANEPIAFLFGNPATQEGIGRVFAKWMIPVTARIESDPELARLALGTDATELPVSDTWTALLRDRTGRPLVRTATRTNELLLQIAAPPSSYFAAALARAALAARYGRVGQPEKEVLAIPAGTLSSWTRAPGPVGESAWRHADESDARWLWLAVLVLLGVEQWLRSRAQTSPKEDARAAA